MAFLLTKYLLRFGLGVTLLLAASFAPYVSGFDANVRLLTPVFCVVLAFVLVFVLPSPNLLSKAEMRYLLAVDLVMVVLFCVFAALDSHYATVKQLPQTNRATSLVALICAVSGTIKMPSLDSSATSRPYLLLIPASTSIVLSSALLMKAVGAYLLLSTALAVVWLVAAFIPKLKGGTPYSAFDAVILLTTTVVQGALSVLIVRSGPDAAPRSIQTIFAILVVCSVIAVELRPWSSTLTLFRKARLWFDWRGNVNAQEQTLLSGAALRNNILRQRGREQVKSTRNAIESARATFDAQNVTGQIATEIAQLKLRLGLKALADEHEMRQNHLTRCAVEAERIADQIERADLEAPKKNALRQELRSIFAAH